MTIVLCYALITGFVVLAATHLVMAYLRLVRRRTGFSSVPLVNGLLGSAGLALHPDAGFASLFWVPFVLDWGCLPMVIEGIVVLLWSRRSRRGRYERCCAG